MVCWCHTYKNQLVTEMRLNTDINYFSYLSCIEIVYNTILEAINRTTYLQITHIFHTISTELNTLTRGDSNRISPRP